jgi:ATP-dependent exoDNAse (exonuclease V) beta subunit
MNVFVATDALEPPSGYSNRVQIERVARAGERPQGARFGTLVHQIMRDVELAAKAEAILPISRTHARVMNATEEEIEAATQAAAAALLHPLLDRARGADRLHRELPILINDDIGGILEAILDLVFLEGSVWIVVDFKTDAEDPLRLARYRRQVGWYIHSIEKATGMPARGYLLHL